MIRREKRAKGDWLEDAIHTRFRAALSRMATAGDDAPGSVRSHLQYPIHFYRDL